MKSVQRQLKKIRNKGIFFITLRQKDPQLRLRILFIASSSRKILNCGRGGGRFLEKNQNFFRCFQNALRKWLLIQPENGCLSLLSPCTRRTPCSNKREKPLQAKLDYFFFYCSIKKPKTLENKGFRRYYLARQKGFEPPAFPLGVAPIRHREVTSNAKKCLEIQGFSAFQILSDTTL